jgi:hypothetical protein
VSEDPANVQCRTFGHRWLLLAMQSGKDIVEPPKNADVQSLTELVLKCDSCQTTRTDYIRRASGVVFRRKYIYPDGYLTPKGEERLNRKDFRLKVLSLGMKGLARRKAS